MGLLALIHQRAALVGVDEPGQAAAAGDEFSDFGLQRLQIALDFQIGVQLAQLKELPVGQACIG
jgi:hypothetical protein